MKTDLEQRKAAIEKQFADYDAEMKRLQGEHRLIVDMLAKLETEEPKKDRRIRKVNATNK